MAGRLAPDKVNRHIYPHRIHDEAVVRHAKGSYTQFIEDLIESCLGVKDSDLKQFIKLRDQINNIGSKRNGKVKRGRGSGAQG